MKKHARTIVFPPTFVMAHQKLMWPIIRIFLYIFKRYEVCGAENLKGLAGPLIIVSSHKSKYDGYFIGASLPFMSTLFPVYFMTDFRYMERPILGAYLRSIGDFPVYEKVGLDQSLKIATELLNKRRVVCIMPEGKLHREDGITEGKIGAAALALRTKTPILPIAIKGGHAFNERTFFFRRHSLRVAFGAPFMLCSEINQKEDECTHYQKQTEVIMEKIRTLYDAL